MRKLFRRGAQIRFSSREKGKITGKGDGAGLRSSISYAVINKQKQNHRESKCKNSVLLEKSWKYRIPLVHFFFFLL